MPKLLSDELAGVVQEMARDFTGRTVPTEKRDRVGPIVDDFQGVIFLAKSASNVAKGSEGTFTIYGRGGESPGSELSIGDEIPAYCRMCAYNADDWAYITQIWGAGGTAYEVLNTECDTNPNPPPIITGCSECTGSQIARYWELTVAGITNGTDCISCNRANGTWILLVDPDHPCTSGPCLYGTLQAGLSCCTDEEYGECTGAGWPPASPGQSMWRMFIDDVGGTDVELDLIGWENPPFCSTGGIYARWTLPIASFDCVGPNTLNIDPGFSQTNLCDNYPATLTVTPTNAP